MDVFEAIRTRRSLPRVMLDERPSREVVEELIELATWAPNHKLTEPWRFHVIAGHERQGLGAALQAGLLQLGNASPEKLASAPAKPLRAPVIIGVSARAGSDDLQTRENHYATAAAIQNLLLGAHARGLGAIWRTGAAAYSRPVADWLGLETGEEVLGFVYVGHPAATRSCGRSLAPQACTTWRGWD